jgi:hypothetical protein
MRSISGFNSTAIQGSFAPGQPIFASTLNALASAADKAYTMPSNDLVFNAGTGGTAYSLPQHVYVHTPAGQFNPYDNGDGTFSVVPGTLNSLIPCVGAYGDATYLATASPAPKAEYDWSEEDEQGYKSCYIYLQASPAASSGGRIWPSSDFTTDLYPAIYGYPSTMSDDDETGYILLALAKKKTNAEDPTKEFIEWTFFINNSLWSERHKYSQPDSAYYYFYRV